MSIAPTCLLPTWRPPPCCTQPAAASGLHTRGDRAPPHPVSLGLGPFSLTVGAAWGQWPPAACDAQGAPTGMGTLLGPAGLVG